MDLKLLQYTSFDPEWFDSLCFAVDDRERQMEKRMIQDMGMRVLNNTDLNIPHIQRVTVPHQGYTRIQHRDEDDINRGFPTLAFESARARSYYDNDPTYFDVLTDIDTHPERYQWLDEFKSIYDVNRSAYENVDFPLFQSNVHTGGCTHLLFTYSDRDLVVAQDTPENRRVMTHVYYNLLRVNCLGKTEEEVYQGDFEGLDDNPHYAVFRVPLGFSYKMELFTNQPEVEVLEHFNRDLEFDLVNDAFRWKTMERMQRAVQHMQL